MSVARNDITGDEIKSKINTDAYRDSWERIFGSNKVSSNNEVKSEANETDEALRKEADNQDT